MNTIRRLIYSQILMAVGFVTAAFLCLFFFFDFVDQLGDVNAFKDKGYTMSVALLRVALQIPAHLYELLPISVLIGTIFVMARLAESSEFTILRTSGLGPLRALSTLLTLGLAFVGLTFVFGDYLAPAANRAGQMLQARFTGDLSTGSTGAWLKDRQGAHSYSVNVGALAPDGTMSRVRIFEFEQANGRLLSITKAAQATAANGVWQLSDVERRLFEQVATAQPLVTLQHDSTATWPTPVSTDMVAAALLSPDRMQTIELFNYVRHLEANGQNPQRYEIEFWRKVFYPVSCLVMMVLALPFAYLHFRSGNIAGYVFVGVLVGVSFFLLNNVFGFVGNLHDWVPWLTAAAPGMIYSALALGLFGWLVLRQ